MLKRESLDEQVWKELADHDRSIKTQILLQVHLHELSEIILISFLSCLNAHDSPFIR
jgi:hypothetical protein